MRNLIAYILAATVALVVVGCAPAATDEQKDQGPPKGQGTVDKGTVKSDGSEAAPTSAD